MIEIQSLQDAIYAIKGQQGLTVILGDWNQGLGLKTDVNDKEMVELLSPLQENYGQSFAFCAFNENIDVRWDGSFGVVCEENGEEKVLLLESDTKHNPGMLKFKEKGYDRVKVEEIKKDGRVVFLKFKQLLKKEG
ncbi:MAG: hypothetical protein ACE5K0_10295 [Candidatus Methanofastidiosia archaeon]